MPIPYQKSCKIVAEEGWGAYYHFVYSTFPAGTRVPTFSADLSADGVAALEQANAFLDTQLGQDPAGSGLASRRCADTVVVPAGGSQELVIAGPRAITAIRGSVGVCDRADEMAALRRIGAVDHV